MTWKELQLAIATPQTKLQELKKEFEKNKAKIIEDIQSLKNDFVEINREFKDGEKVVVTIQLPNGNTSDLNMFIAGVRELTMNGDIIYNFKKKTVTGGKGKKIVSDLNYISIKK
jgi:hypothetical protein